MQATPHIFEAITDAGVDPAKARRIERAIAEDQTNRLMTKEDGLRLELRLEQKLDTLRSDLLAKLNSQIMWFVGSMIAIAALLVALLHK